MGGVGVAILRFHRLTRWAFYSEPTFDRVTDRAKNKKTKEKKRKTFVMSLLRVSCRNTLPRWDWHSNCSAGGPAPRSVRPISLPFWDESWRVSPKVSPPCSTVSYVGSWSVTRSSMALPDKTGLPARLRKRAQRSECRHGCRRL